MTIMLVILAVILLIFFGPGILLGLLAVGVFGVLMGLVQHDKYKWKKEEEARVAAIDMSTPRPGVNCPTEEIPMSSFEKKMWWAWAVIFGVLLVGTLL